MKDLKSKLMAEMGDEPSRSPMSEKEIKMQILKQLQSEMEELLRSHGLEDDVSSMLSPESKELQKVSVMAPDEESLEEGLMKAQEIISEDEEDDEEDED